MWHIEIFNAREDPSGLVTFMRHRALPYFRRRGFHVRFFVTQHELGPRDFWFMTEVSKFSDLDYWPEWAAGEPEGAAVLDELLSRIAGAPRASIAAEVLLPGASPLRWETCPLWHVELFNSGCPANELEALFRSEALPYWRERGFTVHLLVSQLGLGPRHFWLVTGLQRFADLDAWEERACGEPRGRLLMERLGARIVDKRAHVIRDIEA